MAETVVDAALSSAAVNYSIQKIKRKPNATLELQQLSPINGYPLREESFAWLLFKSVSLLKACLKHKLPGSPPQPGAGTSLGHCTGASHLQDTDLTSAGPEWNGYRGLDELSLTFCQWDLGEGVRGDSARHRDLQK